MKNNEEHEPELTDMDDYQKPMSRSKLRTIIIGFAILAAILIAVQGSIALFTK